MGNQSSAERHLERRNNITWNSFIGAIKEMNQTCKHMMEPNGDYLCFALAKESMNNVFWRQNITILCFKVNDHTKKIVSCKSLTFGEFMNAYTMKKAMPINQTTVDMSRTCHILAETADDEGKCVICMDSTNQVLLPCLHAFCLFCVSQQMEIRTPFCCPICRTAIPNPIENSWEVTDIPEPHEVAEYLTELAQSEKR